MTLVLDASVFVSVLSPAERHHARARGLFASHPDGEPFLVPDLFRVEVVAGLARRGEPPELLDTVDAMIRGARFCSCPVDAGLLELAVQVARTARLRAYDAVYVALALSRSAPLLTLDAEVVERGRAAWPELRVFGEAPVG